jgi:hypothetical protein
MTPSFLSFPTGLSANDVRNRFHQKQALPSKQHTDPTHVRSNQRLVAKLLGNQHAVERR